MIESDLEERQGTGMELSPAEPPDLTVLNLCRRSPPALDLSLFGSRWEAWIRAAAGAAACPVDYVVAPLLAAASPLIGNARWAKATPGWIEPPHLWCASVGDSGSGKSPGADIFYRHILPPIEHRMAMDFSDRVEEHRRRGELADVRQAAWRAVARKAEKKKAAALVANLRLSSPDHSAVAASRAFDESLSPPQIHRESASSRLAGSRRTDYLSPPPTHLESPCSLSSSLRPRG